MSQFSAHSNQSVFLVSSQDFGKHVILSAMIHLLSSRTLIQIRHIGIYIWSGLLPRAGHSEGFMKKKHFFTNSHLYLPLC